MSKKRAFAGRIWSYIVLIMSCIFYDIIDRKRPARIFFEDSDTIVFADINPKAPIHLLVCPKEHHEYIYRLPEHLMVALVKTIGKIAEKLDIMDNFRLQVNNGAQAGQIVGHLHYHFISHGSTERLVYLDESR